MLDLIIAAVLRSSPHWMARLFTAGCKVSPGDCLGPQQVREIAFSILAYVSL
jgi:hypothetical protein